MQILSNLSMFTQTANWWHQLRVAMLTVTSSRCLLGTKKMLRFCTAGLLRQSGPVQAQGAEAPRAPRLRAPRPTMRPNGVPSALRLVVKPIS